MIIWKSWSDFNKMTVEGPVEITFGYTISEIEQDCTKWFKSIYEPDKIQFNELIHSLNDVTKNEIAVTYRVVRKDGEIREVFGTIKKVNNDGMATLKGYLVDLNHLKSMGLELSVKTANMDSTKPVNDTNYRLKSLFHDLMTPISTIELNISMIEQLSSETQSHHLDSFFEKIQRIKRSASRLKSLLDDRDKY